MSLHRLLLLVALAIAPTGLVPARAGTAPPPGVSAQLRDISPAEANRLISRLQELQRQLRAGEELSFELLSGAPASYPMTDVSPRQAFLQMVFDRPFRVERARASGPLWRPFRMVLLPNGPGQLIWEVEVVLGANDRVERVQMIYRPPAPY
jgi:hypothetical protein